MATDKDLARAQQGKEFDEEVSLDETGLTQPAFGPSDSSDSGNDVPSYMQDTDSDRNSTGARPDVENRGEESLDDDIEPDKVVPQEQAGLAHSSPDPARNGGTGE